MFHRPTTSNTALLSIIWATCAFGGSTDVNLSDPFAVNKLIGRGVSIGNALERRKKATGTLLYRKNIFS